MSPEIGPWWAIVLIAAITYVTRVAGLAMMARTRVSRRVEGFLDAVAGSILIALVLPTFLVGDSGGKLAALVAFGLMVRFGNAFNAMVLGVVATILFRAL